MLVAFLVGVAFLAFFFVVANCLGKTGTKNILQTSIVCWEVFSKVLNGVFHGFTYYLLIHPY